MSTFAIISYYVCYVVYVLGNRTRDAVQIDSVIEKFKPIGIFSEILNKKIEQSVIK